jgi:hypothetical protein
MLKLLANADSNTSGGNKLSRNRFGSIFVSESIDLPNTPRLCLSLVVVVERGRRGEEWRGVERGGERSGEEWRGVERIGEEWRGVERSGEEWRGVERKGSVSLISNWTR